MIKSVIGVDIAKDDFHVCFKLRDAQGKVTIKGSKSFKNSKDGFDKFFTWAHKKYKAGELWFILEATGVYHEQLTHFLYDNEQKVAVTLANKMKSFSKSFNIKTKTDKVDASVIAQFGIERTLEAWEPMCKEYKYLRDLNREKLVLQEAKQRAGAQLHAYQHSHEALQEVLDLKQKQIQFYEENIRKINSAIKKLVGKDKRLNERINYVTSIPGIGFDTAITILSETNGFELFENIRQLISYAGLDVTLNQSGNFMGKSRISKKGNARIRKALYMPALNAVRYNKPVKNLYERILEKNPKIKQKGNVAAMRKLLILVYTLWNKQEPFDPNYTWKPFEHKQQQIKQPEYV